MAVVWGFGVSLAIYCSATLSGAHLNPAVTLAVALLRSDTFPPRRILPYWGAQLAGAILAGVAVLVIFAPFLDRFEAREGLVRGAPGSERSAMIFGEYFPNPAMFGTGPDAAALTAPWQAALVEGFGTAILVLVIFALTDPRNRVAPGGGMVPFFIGFTVAALICLFAPITQAGLEPRARLRPTPGGLGDRLWRDRHPRSTKRILDLYRRPTAGRCCGWVDLRQRDWALHAAERCAQEPGSADRGRL